MMGRTKRIVNVGDEGDEGEVALDSDATWDKNLAHRNRAPLQQQKLMRRWRIISPDQPSSASNKDVSKKGRKTKAVSRIPKGLGDAFSDPGDVIRRVDCPEIPNIASLWYWMNASSGDASGGYLRGLRSFWESLIFHRESTEIGYLSVAMYIATRKLGELTSTNVDKPAARSKIMTVQSLRSYEKVTPCLLVTIGNLALVEMAEGDIATSKVHWKALASFSDYKLDDPETWSFVNGLDVRFAANLLVRPALPYHLPKALRKPLPFSPEVVSRGVRLGSDNAMAFYDLLGTNYLEGRHLFVQLHHLLVMGMMKDDIETLPIFGHIYDIVYKSTTLVAIFKEELPSPFTHFREILAITISLVFWGASANLIPQEGIIQYNLVKRASALLRLQRGVFVKKWLSQARAEGMLWIMVHLALQAWLFRPDDFALWAGVLEESLAQPDVKALDFSAHIRQWPYTASDVEVLKQDPWTLVRMAEKLSRGELQVTAPKESILL